jgi:hypothetical protein
LIYSNKGLNNCIENAHQPTRRNERSKNAQEQRTAFAVAKSIWDEGAGKLLAP